jgi:hypothetical protein
MDPSPAGSDDGRRHPGPPGGEPAAAPTLKTLWIVLTVLSVVVVLVVVGLLGAALLDNNQDVTATVEKNLPGELQSNFAAQGLTVTVSRVDWAEIPHNQGAFTTDCDIIITGLADPVKATITGSLTGKTVRVDDARSDTTILNADLAVEAAQPAVDSYGLDIKVESCTLPSELVIVTDGLTFTCLTDTNETVTLEIQNGKVGITAVS